MRKIIGILYQMKNEHKLVYNLFGRLNRFPALGYRIDDHFAFIENAFISYHTVYCLVQCLSINEISGKYL